MTTNIQRLGYLGWKARDEGRQQEDGECILATVAGTVITLIADQLPS